MKFKDKHGKLYESIEEIRRNHCKYISLNGNCKIFPRVNGEYCLFWCKEHPLEAAKLMGYEVAEDVPDTESDNIQKG